MPQLSQQRWAANFSELALGFSKLIAFSFLPEPSTQHALEMKKFMVKNVVSGGNIFSQFWVQCPVKGMLH